MNKLIEWWNRIILFDRPPKSNIARTFITKYLLESIQLSKNGSYSDSGNFTKKTCEAPRLERHPKTLEKDPYAIK